jgi:hypothetical protein
MALTSFTLRKTSGGSNLQKPSSLDNSIRADGVSAESKIAGITTGVNTFSANIIGTGVVRLEWTLEDSLTEVVIAGLGDELPVELRIISSFSGEPVTVRDGIFVQSITSNNPTDTFDDVPLVQEGRWVYYSLFAKYSNGTDFWFIRVASLYIQIPINYQSVESFWRQIPEYYKSLDYTQPDLTNGYTPLFAFLELFGNEVDRTRTLIESIALSNDPELAVTPALQQLASQVGLEITTDDLGTSKVRALLNSIGTLRQQKGTIGSISSYISALSGCRVEYVYAPLEEKAHVFNVHAQRINFIYDPEFDDSTITTSNITVIQTNGNTLDVVRQTTDTWGVLTYGSNTIGASNPVITNGETDITITMPAGSYDNRTVFVYPRFSFPYLGTETYGTSYDFVGSVGASFNSFHLSLDSVRNLWESMSTSWPVSLFADDAWHTGTKYAYGSSNSRPSIEYIASVTSASSTADVVPVLIFTMAPNSSITVGRWLFEPSTSGEYFSGSTREGGYIPIQTGSSGEGTFDYYWDTGGVGINKAYSLYLLDHERTLKTTERVIAQYVAPVTMLDDYIINWDYYPGK